MIYVFNKNKMFSYIIACSLVLLLFTFHEKIIPNDDVELVKVSSNVLEENVNLNEDNNVNNNY